MHKVDDVLNFGVVLVLIDFTYTLQGFYTATGANIWLRKCQLSNADEYG